MTSSAELATRAARGWQRAVLLTAGLALGFAAVGCTADSDRDVTLNLDDNTPVGIDRGAVLGELDEVRDLFAERSNLPAEVIADVSYEEGALNVTLAETEGVDAGGAAEQAEQICNDLSEAIQLPDLAITVDGPDGTRLASCDFGQ